MNYELTFILRPELADKERDVFVTKAEKWISEAKGKVQKKDVWGKKRLTYPILKKSEGIYLFMALEIMPKEVGKLDRKFKLDDSVIRYLLVKKD